MATLNCCHFSLNPIVRPMKIMLMANYRYTQTTLEKGFLKSYDSIEINKIITRIISHRQDSKTTLVFSLLKRVIVWFEVCLYAFQMTHKRFRWKECIVTVSRKGCGSFTWWNSMIYSFLIITFDHLSYQPTPTLEVWFI